MDVRVFAAGYPMDIIQEGLMNFGAKAQVQLMNVMNEVLMV